MTGDGTKPADCCGVTIAAAAAAVTATDVALRLGDDRRRGLLLDAISTRSTLGWVVFRTFNTMNGLERICFLPLILPDEMTSRAKLHVDDDR